MVETHRIRLGDCYDIKTHSSTLIWLLGFNSGLAMSFNPLVGFLHGTLGCRQQSGGFQKTIGPKQY